MGYSLGGETVKSWILGLSVLVLTRQVSGQGVITGVVRDDSTGRPLQGVDVLIEGTGWHGTSNMQGKYAIDIGAGSYTLLVRRLGYQPLRVAVRVTARDTVWVNPLLVTSAQQLEPVEVTAEPERREWHLRTFEEHRRLGFGKFMDSTYLRRWDAVNFSDLLIRVPGVGIGCEPPRNVYYKPCYAVSGRSPQNRTCRMKVYVDGFPSDFADVRTGWKVTDLVAVEIYRSAAEIPPEYNSASSACGVLALWTRKS